MINQEYVTTELKKTLEKMLILSKKRLNNLIHIVLGILLSESVKLSDISKKLKDSYTKATEESKIKRIYRFLTNKDINCNLIYYYFINKLMKKYIKRRSNEKLIIIFDHTTICEKFLILQFSLKVGRRSLPIWFKIFKYKEDKNKDFKHVKEGLKEIHQILEPYKYDVIILADRGFKSIDLFEFINSTLKWKYAIRCTKGIFVEVNEDKNITKLEDIIPKKNKAKYYNNILLTAKKYLCNLAVCKSEDSTDIWYIISNFDSSQAIREYKKRFQIEEMFKDMKSNGFNIEDTWCKNLTYAKNLYLCICIAYSYILILGADCAKNKKSKLIGATKKLKNKFVRIYSLFKSGLIWFNRCFNSKKEDYNLKFNFVLYDI